MRAVAVARALQVGSAVLLGGGLLFGVAPLPLHSSGCISAFAGTIEGGIPELMAACSQQRADRQNLVLELSVVSLGLTAGAEAYLRLSRREAEQRVEKPATPSV
jgi:hypothetical protein